MRRLLPCIIALAALASLARPELVVSLSAHATAVVVRDVVGRSLTLLTPPKGHVDLLFFINRECPISNRYAPEINRICGDYRAKSVGCVLVYPDTSVTPEQVAQHGRDYAYGGGISAVIDRDFALTKAVDATVTPQAFVYTASGAAYHGRIDDLYVDVGRARRAASTHDLRSALDAVLTGRSVRVPVTEPVGCSIERR